MRDIPLLQQYVRDNSEAAFREVVERHLNLVYAAALRQVRDPALAQDVVQAVFLILAKKAGKISANTILSGWLYRTTHFVAAKALRSELRRKHHEQEAAQMQTTEFSAPDRAWEKLEPVLDAAMVQLNEKDRTAILLRYFENKDMAGVGFALGTNEDAAQKRVSRALEKLRRLFSKRGIVLPSLVLGSTIAAHAADAVPAFGLGQSVVVNCLNKAVVAPGIYALVQESLRQLLWIKLAKAAGATGLLIAGAFFFAENFPVHAKEKEVAGNFGPGNNSVAPRKRVVTQKISHQVERVAFAEPFRVSQIETAVALDALPDKPAPQITNVPAQPLKPVALQLFVPQQKTSPQLGKSAAYFPLVVAKTNSASNDFKVAVAPTNDSRSLPVIRPRSINKPVITRRPTPRKTSPASSPRNDEQRRTF